MSEKSGTVSGLWIYPVQSLRGQAMTALDFQPRGLTGDRGYGIADLNRGSWWARPAPSALGARSLPGMPYMCARLKTMPICRRSKSRFPDGAHVMSDDADVHRLLSDRLGKGGRIAAAMTAPRRKCAMISPPPSLDQRHA